MCWRLGVDDVNPIEALASEGRGEKEGGEGG